MFAHSLFALFVLGFTAVIFLPALIIGSVGAHRLRTTRQQQSLYASTLCFVSNETDEALPYNCDCDGCHRLTCYAEHFAVQYPIENGSSIFSMIHIDEEPRLLQIQVNNSYVCYYDRTSVTNVHWSMPNERSDLTMVIAGFSVAGLVIVAVVVSQIWWLAEHNANKPAPYNRS